jgi:RNA polymerase sigma factor (TIGR02999 family)
MSDVTRILSDIEHGNPQAPEQLLPLVYEELRQLASQKLAHEKPGQTLQPTALVHEAYLRLVRSDDPGWNGRGHFFAAAAEAMRRILIEQARRKRRPRHGGVRRRVELDHAGAAAEGEIDDLLAVDQALDRLAAEHPDVAAVVKLRYFVGLTAEEAAAALGISLRTANRHWAYAKAWLFQALRGDSVRKESPP